MKRRLYFFVGTTAELIKLLPVLRACASRKLPYRLIASGQNDLSNGELLRLADAQIDIHLHQGALKPSTTTLFAWFARTYQRGKRILQKEFDDSTNPPVDWVVHGDTLSTVMGAWFARHFKLRLVHIEAGLRSFNYLNPFPEEINRVIVSKRAQVHFCPNDWAFNNLTHVKGEKLNTGYNTLIDSLRLAKTRDASAAIEPIVGTTPFCIFVLHRQENLYRQTTVRSVVDQMQQLSQSIRCVFILHALTRARLETLGLLDGLTRNPNITLVPRLPYVDFVHLLEKARFMITDGGSNQEEAYYFGKPCLVLRKRTERIEGLNQNVILSRGDRATVERFLENPEHYRREPVVADVSPSERIADYLAR